jgi:EmrB/QacA subfamily drug resistance transporter
VNVSLATARQAASQRRRWIALVVVCLAQLMNALDATIVNVALPSIQHELHFSQANLVWVVNAYLITLGSFLLLAGRLGDLIGRKRVFLGGIVLFTVASAFCALAHDQAVLIGARFAQGIGSAMSSSVIVAIIVTEFTDPLARARAMSVYIFVAVGGGSIGLLVGGALTQAITWHWIFLINLPIGLLALVLGAVLIVENEGIGLGHGVDWAGSILVTVALMAGVYAIVGSTVYGWTSTHTLGFAGASIALLAAFVALQARLRNPIMPLRILRLGSLTGSSLVRGMAATGMFTAFFLGALYLEHVLGYSPSRTGMAFLPQTLAVAVLSMGITARLSQRFGARRLLAFGLATMIGGLVLLSRTGEHDSYFPRLFAAFLMLGIGGGTSFMPLLTIAMAEVPGRDAGLASGIINVSMQVSAAIGLAALGAIATGHSQGLLARGYTLTSSLTAGYDLAFTVAAACVAVGLIGSLVVLRSPDRASQPG